MLVLEMREENSGLKSREMLIYFRKCTPYFQQQTLAVHIRMWSHDLLKFTEGISNNISGLISVGGFQFEKIYM